MVGERSATCSREKQRGGRAQRFEHRHLRLRNGKTALAPGIGVSPLTPEIQVETTSRYDRIVPPDSIEP
jgi:hypothetical protein